MSGLHAALLHHLEGPGQQRRVPQQDHRDDAQFHDLDRGKMARRRQQSGLTPEQRAAGKKAIEETIITASFPNKPDGTPIKYRSDVKTGLIFTNAKNKAEGKEFVKFLLQEENLRPYIEGALGRWFPVTRKPGEPVLAG
jgi:hypothetical protein